MTSNADRQAKHRANGRPISLTLTDAEAIKKLEQLTLKLGGLKKAIEYALKAADPWGD